MVSVKKLLKKNSSRDIKRLSKLVDQINKLESSLEILSDEELQQKTDEFKARLAVGQSIDDIKVEAFAVVREASKRVLGLRHYDVQLMGGLCLCEGSIAEMQTGEGKTLVASLPSYIRALEEKGVHVITVNEYLAQRDYEKIGSIHQFLGLSVGINLSKMSISEKQKAYSADITYGTGNEFGFDYLRDHMVLKSSEKVQRPLHYAIIDEVDSILIDEARTPLIIANKSNLSSELFYITSKIVKSFVKGVHYEAIMDTKQLFLTDKGAEEVEKAFGIENLFHLEHQLLFHFIMQSLRAHAIMKKDVDYIIHNDEVKLVDLFTGRVMEGRSYSEGLQQAIEAKEGLEVKEENVTQATITIQNYFKLYTTISGMTGTASTEKDEFWQTYGLNVIEIPTNKPKLRIDHETIIYKTTHEKYSRIINEVKHLNEVGRPVLIGTTSIEQSEALSLALKKENIQHLLLNAKSVEQEARMISMAGQRNSVMIATNMAGRGTDILLGEGVAELGGMHIIGTEKNESRRIDNQLRGRAGRQGDPGSSQFILSLEDELFRSFDSEEVARWTKKIKTNNEGLVVQPDPIKLVDRIQESIEGILLSSRGHMLKLDNVGDQQRKVVYAQRNAILESTDLESTIDDMLSLHINKLVDSYINEEMIAEEWDVKGLIHQLSVLFPEREIVEEAFKGLEKEEIMEKISILLKERKELVTPFIGDSSFESKIRSLMLQTLDTNWLKLLDEMGFLKEGIHLRSVAQEDPYRIFEKEAYDLFLRFLETVREDISSALAFMLKEKMEMIKQ
ncbi:accessory Sec system translocase SecA2 [Fictibacillus sp. 7GRE50]|uniref:accessory Sec system translocase SecA2 n=1 Tax=Fictibacillus sp. 7GRE50 TaxID=2745878 RepID=UPI001E51F253|nr:accessory Sec system translocase SecA2 [Fictibacillus sp. 7GRE50]